LLLPGRSSEKSNFEKCLSNACFVEDGCEKHEAIEDDTSIIMNLKGKGLVILSGYAQSGIINIVLYAREDAGIEKVHVIMGGFHLSGPLIEPIIKRTTDQLKKLTARYIIPVHSTGHKAVLHIKKGMLDEFILNIAGTKLTFV
jgi:7,8-dihydropterin-6-yl-methyl-4-(beta-D-ribofuranosyl)aminobenzene 5'-phosphate synthase